MNDEKFFVNRHGKKVTVEGEIVEAPTQTDEVLNIPQPATVAQKPKKIRKVRNKRPVKKILLIALIVIFALLLVPVVGGELVRARYVASRDAAEAQLREYAIRIVVPQQKKQVTLGGLSGAAEQVEKSRDDACDGGLLDNMAMVYPRAKTALDQCITFKQKVAAVAVSLRDMESQVRYLDGLSPVIDPVAKGTDEEFAVISAQLANWQSVYEGLGKLSPAASQKAAHEQLKAQAKAIMDAWSALNTANNTQDGVAFTEAEKKLGEAYEAFRSSSSSLANILNETQTKLTASYKAL